MGLLVGAAHGGEADPSRFASSGLGWGGHECMSPEHQTTSHTLSAGGQGAQDELGERYSEELAI